MSIEKLAGCLIIENRRILLVKEMKDWCWKIPGGKIENEEEPGECAIRGAKEEAGIDIKITGFFKSYRFNFKNREFQLEVYKAEIANGVPHPQEVNIQIGWFPIENLNSEDTTPSNKLIYNDLKK